MVMVAPEQYVSLTYVNDDGSTVLRIWEINLRIASTIEKFLKHSVGEPNTEALGNREVANEGAKAMLENGLIVLEEMPDGH